jgi:hypothetical protein
MSSETGGFIPTGPTSMVAPYFFSSMTRPGSGSARDEASGTSTGRTGPDPAPAFARRSSEEGVGRASALLGLGSSLPKLPIKHVPTSLTGKIIPKTKTLQIGPRGGLVIVDTATGKKQYLKEYQRKQCMSGSLAGDRSGFCGLIANRAQAPPHGKPYGGYAFKDNTPLPPAPKRKKWTWSKRRSQNMER